jgi:hypothetical protein
MAAYPETPFSLLLLADSEHPLPYDDKEVTTALVSYRATFQKGKKFAPNRLNLLAGLTWVHAHQDDLHVAWPAASVAQITDTEKNRYLQQKYQDVQEKYRT